MSCNNVQILNFNHNVVEVGSDNKLIITDNVKCNSVTIPQPVTNILQINSPGPQGPAGANPSGPNNSIQFKSGSFLSGSSKFTFNPTTNTLTLTGSMNITGSLTVNTINVGQNTLNFIDDNGNFKNSLSVTGNNIVIATGSLQTSGSSFFSGSFVGPLQGTASWAINFISASNYVLNNQTGSMLAPYLLINATSSMLQPYLLSSQTSSFVLNSQTSSILAPYLLSSQTSSFITNDQTSSFVTNSQTSSFVQNSQTSSFVLNNQTSSMTAGTASYVTGSIFNSNNPVTSASYATTASYALNVPNIDLSGYTTTSSFNSFTSSYNTGSFSGSLVGTASWATNFVSASNYVLNSTTSSMLAPYLLVSQTSSFVLNSQTSSMLAPYLLSNQTSSFVTNNQTSSFVLNTQTSSMLAPYLLTSVTSSMLQPYLLSSQTSSFLTTGSFGTTQTISGSLIIDQNLTVLGTQSIQYITSSQLNISTNLITVNTATPAIRFGGLAVYDSGSTGTGRTGSILWDSQDNQWIYSNPSGSDYDSAVFLVGPRNITNLGSEVGITSWYAAIGNGSHHMTSSQIYNSGSLIRLETNTEITGSLNVSAGITGSLQGTASWATNFVSASDYVLNSTTSSMLSSYLLSSQTSSFIVSNQTSSFVLNSQTSSMLAPYLLSSQTSSFITNTQTSSFVINDQTSSMLSPYLLISTTSSMLSPYALSSTLNSYLLTSATSSMLQPYLLSSQTSSFITSTQTSSFVTNDQTSSMLAPYLLSSQTSSFITNNQTSSFVLNSQTSSMTVATASWATSSYTASYLSPGTYQITSSWAEYVVNGGGDTSGLLSTASFNNYTSSNTSQFAGTASYATTASYAMNGGGGGITYSEVQRLIALGI